ncbi:MAG: tight adherence protein [Gaiellales bacterium]|jgi:tight adherence protein B|nr:tight adherence protein [Gaiellales bacterium]MDX6592301.1 tight adherence protein [Gaiellales bacterium]
MRRVAILGALVALVVVAPAAAATGFSVKKIDTSSFPTVRVTVQTPNPGQAPALKITENGVAARNVTPVDPGAAAAIALVIDTSNSMAGAKIKDAIAAASDFAAAQRNGNLLAVYGFDSQAYPAARLSTDRTEIVTAISQLGTGGQSGTALYGAVQMAAGDLRTAPAQRKIMILLTDGASASDTATIQDALTAAKDSGVDIYPIGIGTTGDAQAALVKLAKDTGGTATAATDSASLVAVYDAIATELGSTYTYLYQSTAAPGAPIELSISANGSEPVTQTVNAPGDLAPAAKRDTGLPLPEGAMGRALIGGTVGLFFFLAVAFLLTAKPSVILHKRIAPHTGQRKRAAIEVENDPTKISLLHQLFISTERIIGSLKFWDRMSTLLERGDLPLRTAELFYIQIGSALFTGAFTAFVLGRRGLFVLAALAVGAMLPVMFVKYKAKKRLSLFEHQLPETLITMAASLKAGHAFNQAVASAVKEGAEPTAKEFSRVQAEVQLGMNSEAALEAMAKRMNSYNFGFVVMAVNIQRTVGGSLADILDMVSDTVRQRHQFENKVKALTAQGRMSAYVLLAMPFLMGLAIFALNPAYMSILFTSSAGKFMVAGSLVMMAIGSMIIRKIVSFKG